ncbi:MAG: class IV adenylate cyclase [Solidesulfovibrio sp. DCME]|uniref:class IV adenylate cyclase n=1 Tax=Solidesulfovibrio sp. DCME TaxID=3447380 RepID=UPI003D0CFBDD
MPRNIEVKARIPSLEAVLPLVQSLADGAPEALFQDDTFFTCPTGRLKLRDFGNGRGQLIFYQRPDAPGPTQSRYRIHETADPAGLRETLSAALGVIGRVVKRRLLFFRGQTRIYLDAVEGLGDFLELEVVLEAGQSAAAGLAIAEAIFSQLGLPASARLPGAYRDLLEAAGAFASGPGTA